MNTMLDDLKSFVKEHRNVIYCIVGLLLIDRFFLGGKLTEKIKSLAERGLGAVEKKLDGTTPATPTK